MYPTRESYSFHEGQLGIACVVPSCAIRLQVATVRAHVRWSADDIFPCARTYAPGQRNVATIAQCFSRSRFVCLFFCLSRGGLRKGAFFLHLFASHVVGRPDQQPAYRYRCLRDLAPTGGRQQQSSARGTLVFGSTSSVASRICSSGLPNASSI